MGRGVGRIVIIILLPQGSGKVNGCILRTARYGIESERNAEPCNDGLAKKPGWFSYSPIRFNRETGHLPRTDPAMEVIEFLKAEPA